jgi:hypothetical protein
MVSDLGCVPSRTGADLVERAKKDVQKIRIAKLLRQKTTITLAWTAAALHMGFHQDGTAVQISSRKSVKRISVYDENAGGKRNPQTIIDGDPNDKHGQAVYPGSFSFSTFGFRAACP